MKPRINYRAERAERSRKKAQRKEAKLAALSRKPEEAGTATQEIANGSRSLPNVHRFSD